MVTDSRAPATGSKVGEQIQLRGILLENSVFFAGSAVLVIGLNAASSIIVARLLASEESYGMLSLILSLIALFGPFAVLAVPEGVTKLVAESRGSPALRTTDVVTTAIIFLLVTSVIVASVFALTGQLLAVSLYNQESLGILLVIGSISIITSAGASLVLSTLRGLEKVRTLGVINIVNAAASIPLAVVLLPILGLAGAVAMFVLNPLVTIAFGGAILRKEIQKPEESEATLWSGHILRRLMRFSSPLFLSTLMMVGVVWLLNTLLVVSGSFAGAGQFRIAYNLYAIFITLTSAIAVPLMPLVSRIEASQGSVSPTLLSDVLRFVIMTTIPLTLFVAIFSRQLITLLYGIEYEAAWFPTFTMMMAVVTASMVPVSSAILQGLGRTWQILKFDTIFTISISILSFLIIPRTGSWGVGVAYLFSYGIVISAMFLYLRKLVHFPLQVLVLPLFIALISYVAAFLIITNLGGYALLIAGTACVVATGSVNWLAMSPRERETVRWLANRWRRSVRPVP